MSAKAQDLGGISLLDALRPPDGWVTDYALGTTYSLELPVALSCLVALSGTARDSRDYSLTAALRAIDALGEHVRIVAQGGRVSAPYLTPHRAQHLVDRVVRCVSFHERERLFHPKVWLVRWRSLERVEAKRWRLIVGSRNLTSSVALDLGIMLDSAADGEGTAFDALPTFVRKVGEWAKLEEFTRRADGLSGVRWALPHGVEAARFAFKGFEGTSWAQTDLADLFSDDAKYVLSLSPFADSLAVKELEERSRLARFERDPARRCVVIGEPDLLDIAKTRPGLAALSRLDVRTCLPTTEHVELKEEEENQSEEMSEPAVGLHAKFTAVWLPAGKARCLVGSPNLTRHGWLSTNVEAWMRLDVSQAFVEPLWSWSRNLRSFDASLVPAEDGKSPLPALEDIANNLRQSWASAKLVLTEPGAPRPAELRYLDGVPVLHHPDAHVDILVERLASADPVRWAAGKMSVTLPACGASERSRFLRVLVRVSRGADEWHKEQWIQEVELDPPLDVRVRDAEALAAFLSAGEFRKYLLSLADPTVEDEDPSETTRLRSPGEAQGAGSSDHSDSFSLERLLRSFARSGVKGMEEVKYRLQRAIESYRSAASLESQEQLRDLWEA